MVESNNAINDTVGASITGVTNTLTVTNPSDTASSAARETITVGGTSAGDPTINWNVVGTTDWEMGIDNGDSDKWKLSLGTALGTDDTIVAYTTGEVLKPRNPGFFATINASIPSVTGDDTAYTVIFNTETFDTGSNYDATTGVFTAPVDGIYLFTYAINFSGINAAHNSFISDLFINAIGLHGSGGNAFSQANTTGNLEALGSFVVTLSAADTVSVVGRVANGAKVVSIIASSYPTFYQNSFSGYLVG